MWISNRGHVFRISGIRLHPTGVFSNLLMQKKRHGSRKHMSCQKVIVQYTKDADKDILFTMKVNEMKVCMDVYGLICILCRDLNRALYEKLKLWPIVQSETSGHNKILW